MEAVDTSSKKQTTYIDDDVLSSEDEQERIEEEKERFTATVTVGAGLTGPVANILVCSAGNAQSLTKILFEVGGAVAECGKAEVLY